MDWKDLAGTLIKTGAPIIGTALGGPLGGTVGGIAGKLIADALGVPATPEAVHEAIQADPAGASVALASADAKWQAMAEIAKADAADRTAQSQALNETIRTEIATGMSWWHWRNLLGYVPVVIGAEVAGMVPFVALGKITASDMVAIITAITPLVVTFSGLLGYVAQDTTKLKTTAITGEHAPSATDNVVNAIKKVVGKQPTVSIGKPVGSRD
jgi:hypothetical protein